jgi:hypothetical protein
MKFAKNKTIATLITLFLVLIITTTSVSLPIANAHSPPWIRPTFTFVAAAPPTIGVGQTNLIVFWSNLIPPTSSGAYGERYNFMVYVTSPDGTNETLGPIISDPVGGGYTQYTPTQLGRYSVVAQMLGIAKMTGEPTPDGKPSTNVNVNDTILPSTSEPTYFTVQQEPIQPYPETPVPTDYWTRPIYGPNRGWYQVASNWLSSGMQVNGSTTNFGYGLGPETAHVLWTRSLWAGGIIDERFADISFESSHYEGMSYSPIVLNGVLYYNVGSHPRFGTYAVDLYTGETIYWRNTTGAYTGRGGGFDAYGAITGEAMNFGQILDIENPNQHGGFPYLWSTTVPDKANTWRLWDAYTGNMLCDIANVSTSGTQFIDKIGSICYVNLVNLGTTNAPNYYMQIWNTTEAIWWRPQYGAGAPKTLLNGSYSTATSTSNTYWMWRPYPNATFDGRNGYSMNVSIASILGPRNTVLNETGTILAVRADDFVIVGTAGRNDDRGLVQGYLRALSLKAGQWGNKLWEISFTPPKASGSNVEMTYEGGTQGVTVNPEDGVFFFWEPVSNQIFCYSLDTGQQLWTYKYAEQFSYYPLRNDIGGFFYNSKFFSTGYTGVIHALNVKTGEELWNWSAPSEGLGESWYPYTPIDVGVVCDGKVYLYTSEHSPSQPLRRDGNVWCVDLETGKLVWKMSSWASGMAIADGTLTVRNNYDNQIYCFGKGPSAITVSAPQTVQSLGSGVLITGTVTDQSPSGRHNVAGSLDFSLKGTPAISDADQEAWMEHLFQGNTLPANAKGVGVSLDTIDPNGNLVHISDVTSDINGNFGYTYTPEVPGTYQIIANFKGSNAYGPSSSTTYLSVIDQVPTSTILPETAIPDNTSTIIGAAVAIIIAIAIVGVILLLAIRKRH